MLELHKCNQNKKIRVVVPNRQRIYISDIAMLVTQSSSSKKPIKIIQLLKGQYCKYDAKSAFNYHWKYELKEGSMTMSPISIKSIYTTGLFEYIFEILNANLCKLSEPININVCGNVGNVGVIYTILQGIVMLKKLYNTEKYANAIQFNFYMTGTRFAPGLGGFVAKPTADHTFINMLQQYVNKLKISSFVEGDIHFFKGHFNVYNYDMIELGKINLI